MGDPVLDMYVRLSLFVHIESKHNPSQKVVMLLSDSTVCVFVVQRRFRRASVRMTSRLESTVSAHAMSSIDNKSSWARRQCVVVPTTEPTW